MPYAIVSVGTVTEYPVDLRTRLPNVSMRENWPGGEVHGVTYVQVQPSPQPDHDPRTQNLTEATPALVAGTWTQQWAVSDANAEEVAERLQAHREEQAVPAWQARVVLAGMLPYPEGPLAAVPGANLLEQIDAFAGQALSAPALEKFKGAATWRRTDAMLLQLSALAGLDDAAIDAWFAAAEQVA